MRYIFQIAGAIGNQVQLVPAYLYYLERYPKLDIVYVKLTANDNDDKCEFFKVLARSYGNYIHIVKRYQTLKFDTQVYRGVIACRHHYFKHNLEHILEQTQPHTGNEVDYNNQCMSKDDAIRIMTEQLPLDWFDIRGKYLRHCGGSGGSGGKKVVRPNRFDVIICNGGLNNSLWAKKKYQRWNEIVDALKAMDYTVACVGVPDEYIQGCEDRTGIGIMETMDLIANCGVFASNDSGLSHFACIAGVETVIAYTATNITKNNNKYLHAKAEVIGPTCDKAPCQADWNIAGKWLTCKDWICTYYDPKRILEAILRKLKC